MIYRTKIILFGFICFSSMAVHAQSGESINGSTQINSIKPERITMKVLSPVKLNQALNSYRRFIDMIKSNRPVTQRDRVESWPSMRIVFLGGHLYTVSESSSLCTDVNCEERSTAALVGPSKKFEEMEKVPQVSINDVLQVESIKPNVSSTSATVDVIIKDKDFEFTFQSLGATLDDAKSDFKGILDIQVK